MQREHARLWDFPSAVLLTLIQLTASQRLYATNWAPGLGLNVLIALLGVILGLALGLTRFRRLSVFLLAACLTIIILPITSVLILYTNIPWRERLVSLGGRLANSFLLLVTGQPVQDTALFVVSTALGFWIISLMAGLALSRLGSFAGAAVPTGIALIIIQLFDPGIDRRAAVLAVYLFLCLLLLGRMGYVRKRQRWKQQRVGVSVESARNMNIIFLVAAFVVVILAWFAPSSGRPVTAVKVLWDNLTRPLRKDDSLGNAVAGLQNQNTRAVEFYSDTLALGVQAATGEDVYLHIHIPRFHEAGFYYWRVRTYNLYLNNEWSTSDLSSERAGANEGSFLLADSSGPAAEYLFSAPALTLAQLVTPAHPVWVSRASTLIFTRATNGEIDPLMLTADPAVPAGEQYTVQANLSNPTIAQLKGAGTNYPAWVRNDYLNLPPDLPSDIADLAREITLGAVTPYDKATAITDYLRTNIQYTKTVTPPAGTDPIQWFLFDARQGFCNYYATAEVLMLRSLGIPARLVVGFSQGVFEPPDQYTVRQVDAHAWPELYFPGAGWVEFEPTSSRPPIVRPAGGNNAGQGAAATPTSNPSGETGLTPTPSAGQETGAGSGAPANSLTRLYIVLGVMLAVVVAVALAYVFGWLDKFLAKARQFIETPLPIMLVGAYESLALTPPVWLSRWAHFAQRTPVERAFGVVYQGLRWLGEGSSSARTPAEAAAALTRRLPAVAGEIEALLGQVQRTLYSQKSGDLNAARRTVTAIRRATLDAAVQQRLQVLRHIFSRREKK